MGRTVSVVIPCLNEKEQIEKCLRSILGLESPDDGFEVIVADGMSDDGTRDILSRLASKDPRLRIVDNHRRIVSCGLNAAIRAARGEIIMRMDAHTEYAADYIRRSLAVLAETRAQNVGGPARTKSAGYMQSVISASYHSLFCVGGARFHDVEHEGYVDTVTYGCWPREVFDRIGLFDEELVRNQDDEFNLRLIRAGGKIWQSPSIKSWYRPRSSLQNLFRQYRQYGYWKVRVIQKHTVPASVRHVVPGCFLAVLIALPVVSLWWAPALWVWLALVGIYSLCNIAASVVAAAHHGLTLLPVLPLVFACYHFGYGYGFLRGIIDFIILRRPPAHTYTNLTRA
jgi:glycosyltransferase involved in cell wall biosynthesis